MKLLKNKVTGAVFPFHKGLLKNKNIIPYDEEFEEIGGIEEESSGASSENGLIIGKAKKAELIKFAAENYGVQLNSKDSIEELRQQVTNLVEED